MNKLKFIRGSVLLLILLLTLTACAPAPEETDILPEAAEQPMEDVQEEEESTLVEEETTSEEAELQGFVIGYYVNLGLNPYTCDNTVNQALIGLLYEPLYSVTPQFEAERCIAVGCEKSGEDLWTLTLRSDVRFWNGETLTAEDVLYSLTQAKRSGSIYARRLAPMEELEVTGDYTLSFRWVEERGDLSLLLEIPVVQENTAQDELPMGTGPYLPGLGEDNISKLYVNQDWWQGEELPAREIALCGAETSERLIYGFERGVITLVASDLTDPDSLGYSSQYEVWDYPTSHLIYLGCNTTQGPCAQPALRQTLLKEVDRDTIVRSLLSGHGIPTALTFLPDTACYDSELAASLARSDTDGLAEWSGEKLRLVVNADSGFKTTIARFLAADLNEAGLSVEVRELSWTAYEEAVQAGEYDLYLGEVKLENDFDPAALVGKGGALNFTAFFSQTVEDALAAYHAAGAQQRPAAAGVLSQNLAQEAPIIPICFEEHSILTGWGMVEELSATQSDLFYGFEHWVLED